MDILTNKAKEYVTTNTTYTIAMDQLSGSNDFFSLISNTCGGYSFYKDAKLMQNHEIPLQ